MPVLREYDVAAMGGNAHLVVGARTASQAEAALGVAREQLSRLESLWSRFRPQSELNRITRHAGSPVPVSAETLRLVVASLDAWRRTGGRYDPTVRSALERMESLEFLESLEPLASLELPAASEPAGSRTAARVPGCHGVVVDAAASTVCVPHGVSLDPGGIGKGLAADLVSEAMIAAGAVGALVNVAGDLRVRGACPTTDDGSWPVGLEHPEHVDPLGVVLLRGDGLAAVASSSTLVRRWGDGLHHVIDPRTGRPSVSAVLGVTVLAEEAGWADAVTKVALVAPDAPDAVAALDALGIAAVLVSADGIHETRAMGEAGRRALVAGSVGRAGGTPAG